MSKDYEIEFLLKCVVVVLNAETEEDAFEYAQNEASFGDCVMLEGKANPIEHKHLDSAIRHADKVSRP